MLARWVYGRRPPEVPHADDPPAIWPARLARSRPGRARGHPVRSRPIGSRRPGGSSRQAGDAGQNLTDITRPTDPTGGQITVVGGPPGGVAGPSGAALGGTTVFAIALKGRTIAPA